MTWKKLKGLSLQSKILLLVASSIGILVSGSLWLMIVLQDQTLTQIQRLTLDRVSESLRSEWIKETEVIAEAIAGLIVQPVFTLDIYEINQIVKSIQKQQTIHSVIVLDNNKRTLASSHPQQYQLGLIIDQYPDKIEEIHHNLSNKNGQSFLEVIAPIQTQYEYFGTLILNFPTQGIDADTHDLDNDIAVLFKKAIQNNLYTLISYSIIIVLLGLFAAYIIARQTTRPILSLVKETEKLRVGNFNVELETARKDEIGALNKAFILMSAELVKRQASLEKAKEELESRVEHRTAELIHTNEKLHLEIKEHNQSQQARLELEKRLQQSQKMEALGTLAGGVAHDLNNILTGIVGYPEMVLLELPQNSPLRSMVETMQSTGEKASAIVQDLLTLARRGVMQFKTVNLNEILDSLLTSPEWKKMVQEHPNIAVKISLAPDLKNVSGSTVHLFKSIMNLLTNAIEAIADTGSITILTANIHLSEPRYGDIEIKRGSYAVLKISDTGTGIAESDLPKIFEPFFSQKEIGRSGTGLGMAVVWGTLQDHNGYIDIQTTVGKGTTFSLFFPVSSDKKIVEDVQPSLDNLQGIGQLLVVDDDEVQREIAKGLLVKLGYDITLVKSGEEALEKTKDNEYDLIVLDMIMGKGMDGLETYKKICQQHPGQKAIITSGFSESTRVKEAQELGAGKYIKKPYQLISLAQAVKDELIT